MNTTTECPDYGEPWTEDHRFGMAQNRDGKRLTTEQEFRAVACVNACAGMADPTTEITSLRNALRLAESAAAAALDELQALRWVPVTERMPTLADASEFGDVEWSDGKTVWECRHDDPERATYWRKYTLP